VKIGLKFQSLGKISNISTSDPPPPVLLGQFQHSARPTYNYDGNAVRGPSHGHGQHVQKNWWGSVVWFSSYVSG